MCERAISLVDPSATNTNSPRGHLLRCIGRARHQLGDLDDARAALDKATDVLDGAPNARLAYALVDLGELELSAGNARIALEHCERALAVFTAQNPKDHPDHGIAYACRGRAWLDMGEPEDAQKDLEHALALDGTMVPLRPRQREGLECKRCRQPPGASSRTRSARTHRSRTTSRRPKRNASQHAWPASGLGCPTRSARFRRGNRSACHSDRRRQKRSTSRAGTAARVPCRCRSRSRCGSCPRPTAPADPRSCSC